MEEESEETEDIEWEGEGIEWEQEQQQPEDSMDSGTIRITIRKTEGEDDGQGKPKKKRKKVLSKYTETDYAKALHRRQDNFSSLLTKLDRVVEWSHDSEFQCILLSLLPPQLLHNLTRPPSRCKRRESFRLSELQLISEWLDQEFTIIADSELTEEEGRDGSDPETLLDTVISKRVCSPIQYIQLFYGLLQSFNVRSRVACSFEPLPLSPHGYEDLGDEETRKMKVLKLKPFKVLSQMYCWIELWTCTSSGSSSTASSSNAEVSVLTRAPSLGPSNNRWIHYDCILQVHDEPEVIEKRVRRNKEVEYVIACEMIGSVDSKRCCLFMDVTARYSFMKAKAISLLQRNYDAYFRSWLDRRLQELNGRTLLLTEGCPVDEEEETVIDLTDDASPLPTVYREKSIGGSSSSSLAFLHEQHEEKEQLRKAETINLQTLPKTIAAFQNHPVYCLERHLKQEEILNPNLKKMVAMFKGEAVYLQEHKETLKSKLEWRKEMRQIKDNEVPLKVIKRKVRVEKDETYSMETKERALFAKYQTDSLQIPSVVDGVIPVNEHGNVEVWDGSKSYVPKGAVFIEGSHASKVAKAVGITFAPAVTDFEFKNGKYYPKMGGIVVLERDQQLLQDGMFEMGAYIDQVDYHKQQEKIFDKWKKLTRLMLSRQRLKDTYGH